MSLSLSLFSLPPVLIAIGLTSVLGQLILLREFAAVFYGNELIFGLILAIWMAWVAVGAWIGARFRRSERSFHRLVIGLALTALFLPTQIAAVRASHRLLGVTPGALMPLLPMMLTLALILVPLCLLLGWLFTLSTRLWVAAGGNAGLSYAAESAGALVGGTAFSFLLVGRLDSFQIALGIGSINLTLALGIVLKRQPFLLRGLGTALIALVLVGSAFPLGQRLHHASLDWQYPGLRFVRDSPYGRVAVTGQGEQRAFFVNGLLFFETQGTLAEEVAHLPLLAHPSPRRILLIGGGVSGTLLEIFRHPSVQEVHYVELDPLLVAAARAELPSHQAAALDDPRLTLVHQDGRLYVRQQRGISRFDVVILDLPEPATGQLNRFYTQEFFAEVHAILAPNGLFALHLPWQENYLGPALQRLNGSIYRTLATKFADIVLLPGERLTLLASDTVLPTQSTTWGNRLREREIETRWVVPSYLDYLVRADRVSRARLLLETAPEVRLNHDLTPISYYYDLTVWLFRFYGSLSRLADQLSFFQLGWLVLPLAVIVLLLRRWSVPATVSFTGLAGMTLEVILLFAFQVFHGYVYGQIGLLVTAFMGGLVLGALVGGRWLTSSRAKTRRHPYPTPLKVLWWTQGGVTLLALGCLVCLVFWEPPAWIFPLSLLGAGTLTGLVFPVAVACLTTTEKAEPDQAGLAAGILYGADLTGAWLGAILSSVWWLPILGIPHTCLVVALFGLGGLVVLLGKGR